jgi:two-component system cell cycle sensor histidine kinase/response regulator CckA
MPTASDRRNVAPETLQARPGGASPSSTESTAAGDSGTETVLVVEDTAAVRTIVQRMLSGRGYVVLTAADGQEALAILQSSGNAIDIVLCDIFMPDLSGREIVSRIQARSPRIRALFMSGHNSAALIQDGKLEIGAAFVQKPFTPAALVRKIREVLDV